MWNGIFHVNDAVQNHNVIGYSLLVMIVIFATCVAVDNIRIVLMEKLVCKSKVYRMACGKIEAFYKE